MNTIVKTPMIEFDKGIKKSPGKVVSGDANN